MEGMLPWRKSGEGCVARRRRHVRRLARRSAWLAVLALALLVPSSVPAFAAPAASRASHRPVGRTDGLGIQPGKIKHVWLIILENKSYDATFTGLNHNTYLWRTLPKQGSC